MIHGVSYADTSPFAIRQIYRNRIEHWYAGKDHVHAHHWEGDWEGEENCITHRGHGMAIAPNGDRSTRHIGQGISPMLVKRFDGKTM